MTWNNIDLLGCGSLSTYLNNINLGSSDFEHGDTEELEGKKYGLNRSIEVVKDAGHTLGHTGKLREEMELN